MSGQPLSRPAKRLMRLRHMGARHQTRLSFMRSLLRRLHEENWTIEQTWADWDSDGYGTAVYRAKGPVRSYSLIAYSNYLDAADRSDRVIAEKWDAAFALFDGEPTLDDIERLRDNVPRQEAGRCSASELVLSRANKSVRLFDHVVERLADGRQPEPTMIARTGYLMRTTAVYGNGKFGLSDRARVCARAEFGAPYQAELLAVYLIRCFSHDLVEHVARHRNPGRFVPLQRATRRYLGIGNATGLGMAPFLYYHPILVHRWVDAVETALVAVRAIESSDTQRQVAFIRLLERARQMSRQWCVADERQMQRILRLRKDLDHLIAQLTNADWLAGAAPWDTVYRWVETKYALEAQELVASLLIEIHPEHADQLAGHMGTRDTLRIDPTMSLSALQRLLEQHYDWALAIDFDDPASNHFFWYTSEEKLEPRIGERYREPGAEREHQLTAARDVANLYADIQARDARQSVAEFLLNHPRHRHIVRRVQTLAHYRYAEIRDNLLGVDLSPIDMLRFKLAFFGATKFDPKSNKWMRITLYQGAPLPDEIGHIDSDSWMLLPLAPNGASAA